MEEGIGGDCGYWFSVAERSEIKRHSLRVWAYWRIAVYCCLKVAVQSVGSVREKNSLELTVVLILFPCSHFCHCHQASQQKCECSHFCGFVSKIVTQQQKCVIGPFLSLLFEIQRKTCIVIINTHQTFSRYGWIMGFKHVYRCIYPWSSSLNI